MTNSRDGLSDAEVGEELFGFEDGGPEAVEVVREPPPAQRQTVRDVAVEIEQSPGYMKAVLSKGGDYYDPRHDKRQKVVLEENDKIPPGGQFIGVNGIGFMLRPGVPADVPVAVIHVLNNAIEEVPIVVDERVVGFKERLRYPYRILSRPR